MLKILIADDEERLCQLIKKLVDWDDLHMQVVGTAANGIEAAQMVDELSPDILITDIRMPGCDGLELIQTVKRSNPQIEIIIISGYAYFSYAQAAIKFGVENYLLKPINKVELTETLKKIYQKILERNESEDNLENLIRSSENDRIKVKNNLIMDMLETEALSITMESLQQDYHLGVREGIFQGFCLKMDYDICQLTDSARKIVYDKVTSTILGNLKRVCYEIILNIKDGSGYGILNYTPKKQDDVHRIMRDCLNQLNSQKSILGDIDFTLALGSSETDAVKLPDSLKKCRQLIQERILTGTGSIIEKMGNYNIVRDQSILESYSRKMLHAIELLSAEEGEAAVISFRTTIMNLKNVNGYEIYDFVLSAANLFLAQTDYKKRKEEEEIFRRQWMQCGNLDQLFSYLSNLQKRVLEAIKQERENEALRPIRQAKQYIQNHYKEQITLEEVSDAVGLSSGYFSVLFKKVEGDGFAKYLINFRIEQAKVLLRESNYSVSDICKQVGYNDLKHFT
ncbi:MAG: response regulator, partial [Lachnospiraceae bacterium]|nr:response regulator [Lachnospiraceae bacterium]